MLILITFVLLTIWSALVYNVYSIFRPFINTMGDIQHYNIAYYWAISSIERAELVLRYHTAWFEWSWGWLWTTPIGPSSDKKIENFWLLSKWDNWILRNIKSKLKSNTLPNEGEWNIDYELQRTWTDYGGPSKNFNKL